MNDRLPVPYGSEDSPHVVQSRLERKVRRAFGRFVGSAPEVADVLVDLALGAETPPMVKYLAAKTIMSSVGLGEISKQVQKTTQEIRMQHTVASAEETLARLPATEVDRLLGELDKLLLASPRIAEVEPVEGEFTEQPT